MLGRNVAKEIVFLFKEGKKKKGSSYNYLVQIGKKV